MKVLSNWFAAKRQRARIARRVRAEIERQSRSFVRQVDTGFWVDVDGRARTPSIGMPSRAPDPTRFAQMLAQHLKDRGIALSDVSEAVAIELRDLPRTRWRMEVSMPGIPDPALEPDEQLPTTYWTIFEGPDFSAMLGIRVAGHLGRASFEYPKSAGPAEVIAADGRRSYLIP